VSLLLLQEEVCVVDVVVVWVKPPFGLTVSVVVVVPQSFVFAASAGPARSKAPIAIAIANLLIEASQHGCW
jgi:hypothetical protein